MKFYGIGIRFIYTDPSSPHEHVTGGYIISKNPFSGLNISNSISSDHPTTYNISATSYSYNYNGTTYTAYMIGALPYQERFDPVTVNAPMNEITTENPNAAVAILCKIAVAIAYFNGTIDDEEPWGDLL